MQPESTLEWNTPLSIGSLTLPHRVFMSALTRERCPQDGIPTALVQQYYSQRAGAAIIFTETVAWSQRGQSSSGSGCLYTHQQMIGWKSVIDAVHSKGGRIWVQLSHAGRATHPDKIGGLEVWAPSPIKIRQKIRYLNGLPQVQPKQMTQSDIQQCLKQFEESVKLAKQAGFDGIQLQCAHGYLLDQFTRSATNHRTDQYGGSPQNRIRFVLDVFSIALKYYKPEHLGIKISPVSRAKDMFDEHPQQTFGLLLKEMSKLNIGICEIRESTQPYAFVNQYGITSKEQIQNVCKTLRPYFTGIVIGNDGFNAVTGLQKIRRGDCDAISFGQLYIANPDLAERILNGWQLNTKWDKSTFYGTAHGEKGYTDYPAHK